MPGMFSKYGNNKRSDDKSEEITDVTPAPDLSSPNLSGSGRYDLSGGVTDQMRFDYSQQGAGGKRGRGRGGQRSQTRVGGDASVRRYAENTNKADAQKFAETKGRRSAMNYILKLPTIRGIGASNRGMATSASRLGM